MGESTVLTRLERVRVKALVRANDVQGAVRWLRRPNPHLSPEILRAFGASVGDNVRIKNTLLLDNSWEDAASRGDFSNLHVGNNVYIGDSVYFDLAGPVCLGDDTMIGAHARLVTHVDVNRSAFLNDALARTVAAVTVERGGGVGFGATLLAGSTVATESALAAESLLLQGRQTLPRTLWAGRPARLVRTFA
jgi:carbonic anhydrase/acetyltransferase-like protein (isoleucine patch superfamily)